MEPKLWQIFAKWESVAKEHRQAKDPPMLKVEKAAAVRRGQWPLLGGHGLLVVAERGRQVDQHFLGADL